METACLNACKHVTFVLKRAMIKCLQVLGVAGVPRPAVLGQISDHPAFTELTDFIVRMKSSGEDDLEITNL